MARARKKRYQFLRTLILGLVVFIMLGILVGSFLQIVLVFMLTGIVSGTEVVVPVWGMVAIYVGIVGVPTALYVVDQYLSSPRTQPRGTSPHQLAR